jgi:hypothetical protein
MRKITFISALALAFAVLAPTNASPAAGGNDLPFKGVQVGYATTNLVTGQGHLLTSGSVNHFGFATSEQILQLVPTGPGTFISVGTWTMTAANGDQMFGTITGTGRFSDAVHSTWVANYVTTGGTGRFTDASLTASAAIEGVRLSVEGVIATSFFEGTLVGRLSYR